MHLQHRTKAGRTMVAGATILLLGMTVAGLAGAGDSAALPLAYSVNADADYPCSLLKASGVGSSGLDSWLGARPSIKLDQRCSAVPQLIGRSSRCAER